MRTFAEFQIIGRVGTVKDVGSTLRVSIAADYGRKDASGDVQSVAYWNEITIFNATAIRWVRENVAAGDLVHTRGTIRQSAYEKDGQTVYAMTLAAKDVDLLRKKQAET